MANIASGHRKIAAMGNCQNTSAYLIVPNSGRYYCAVQAIDNGFAGSDFSNEITFVIGELTVRTDSVSNITTTSATCGGEITDDGAYPILEKGLVWHIKPNPTIEFMTDSTNNGDGMDEFSGTLTNLTVGKTYYVRAWAISSQDTAYGEVREFTTSFIDTRDNKVYGIVKIGEQHWMSENLNVGTRINGSNDQTNTGTLEKYCYDDEDDNCETYGGLYQWDNMMQFQAKEGLQGICPVGWRLPTDADWCILEQEVDDNIECRSTGWRGDDGGGKLKETGNLHWSTNNTGATDSIGFAALGNGERHSDNFEYLLDYGSFWSSTTYSSSQAWCRHLGYGRSNMDRTSRAMTDGYGVRCIRGILPTLTTQAVTNIGKNSAACGGEVTNNAGNEITARGLCWGTLPYPAIADYSTVIGAGNGAFSGIISELNSSETYYVRAFATNQAGTAYGEQMEFTTKLVCGDSITDTRDGKKYASKQIGEQCWMAQNLNVGSRIDGSENQDNEDDIEKYCYEDLDANCATYGGLYQWDNMMQFQAKEGLQGVCPEGWRLPTDADWCILTSFLDATVDCSSTGWSGTDAGEKLKEAGTAHWNSPYTGATNSSGFTALGNGLYSQNYQFSFLKVFGSFWSSTLHSPTQAWCRFLNKESSGVFREKLFMTDGYGVRCIHGVLPYVTTSEVLNIKETSVVCGGNVSGDAGNEVTAHGLCWGTEPNPTIAGDNIIIGAGTGTFSHTINGLNSSETYYVRAFATSMTGTAYGEQMEFTCKLTCGDSLTDTRDGKKYASILIGEQCWMAQNLDHGVMINGSNAQTDNQTNEKYCYDNDPANCDTYGGLYQWDEMMQFQAKEGLQGICPEGWRLPTDADWCILTTFLDPTVDCSSTGWSGTDAGGQLKETGTAHWNSPNYGATDSSGFTALPSGRRDIDGSFVYLNSYGVLWTCTNYDAAGAWGRSLNNGFKTMARPLRNKNDGLAVRCLRETPRTVTTNNAVNITTSSAVCGGAVLEDNGYPITEKGIVLSKTPKPTKGGSNTIETTNGSGLGSFSSTISGLDEGQTYYVRAWATSSQGTTYGNEVEFTAVLESCEGLFTDTREGGQEYSMVRIGKQCWMAENLNYGVRVYSSENMSENDVIEKYCYDNEEDSCAVYGGLYQWDEMMKYEENEGGQGICPPGWHLPSDVEWLTLQESVKSNPNYLCSTDSNAIAKALADTLAWEESTESCAVGNDLSQNNATGFAALPAGSRHNNGSFFDGLTLGKWWSSTQTEYTRARRRYLLHTSASLLSDVYQKSYGLSVRCIRGHLPTVTTRSVSDVDKNSATCNCNVSDAGGTDITTRGVCYSLEKNPTIDSPGNMSIAGNELGDYSISIDNLNPGMLYYVRAFATNNDGTAYGEQLEFFTTFDCNEVLIDARGEEPIEYATVKIGEQCWMAENLNVGTKMDSWNDQTDDDAIEKYCYNNDEDNCDTFGGLYQWNEVMQYETFEAAQGICPPGWHLPTDAEWCTLENAVEPEPNSVLCDATGWRGVVAGAKLKPSGNSGFDGLMAGKRQEYITFEGLGDSCYWWSSTSFNETTPWRRHIATARNKVNRYTASRWNAFSVRCIRGALPSIITTSVSNVTDSSALTGGIVGNNGGLQVTARGVCWNKTQNPNTSDMKTINSEGIGAFTSNIEGLTPGVKYYVRAYATNEIGTVYGSQKVFETNSFINGYLFDCGTEFMDPRDHIVYSTATYGTQCWMTENLLHGEFRDQSSDEDQTDNDIFEKYCYNDNENNCIYYGGLYQWDEMMEYNETEGAQGICPVGWHIPSNEEWTTFTDFIGNKEEYLCGNYGIGGIARALAANEHWEPSEYDSCVPGHDLTKNNATGFTALPAGMGIRAFNNYPASYGELYKNTWWWTSTKNDDELARYRGLSCDGINVLANEFGIGRSEGLSVRCVRTALPIVKTKQVFNITPDSAKVMGETNPNIEVDITITERGVCISLAPNPTITNRKIIDDGEDNVFVVNVDGLNPLARYYVRTYAITEEKGTAYGAQWEIKYAFCGNRIGDYRSDTLQIYNTIEIGEQCWMADNLNVGVKINGAQNQTNNDTIQKYCYDNDDAKCKEYGGLYQWYEMMQYDTTSGRQGICPDGWFLPADADWCALEQHYDEDIDCLFVGLRGTAGDFLKESGVAHWNNPNAGNGTNGFAALGSGYRDITGGALSGLKAVAHFWSSNRNNSSTAWQRGLKSESAEVIRKVDNVLYGFSVRCLKVKLPILSTKAVSKISHTTAISGGNISKDGGRPVTEHGLCWSNSPNPTIENDTVRSGSGIGGFNDTITGLSKNTTYYVRAYATNTHGTAYGDERSFSTSFACGDSLTDSRDGRVYPTLHLGNKCLMAANLNYGEQIDGSQDQLENGIIEKYCYDDEEDKCDAYGGLYQWNEMMQYTALEGEQGICPDGWHLPTKAEWTALIDSVKINQDYKCNNTPNFIAKALADSTKWSPSDITCAIGNDTLLNNTTGFTALPGGRRHTNGNFYDLKTFGIWWSSTQDGDLLAWRRFMNYNGEKFYLGHPEKDYGFSVRCVMGDLPTVSITPVSNFTDVSASLSGKDSLSGGMEVTARGFCVGTEPLPGISNTHTNNGSGTGTFEASITGLAPGQTYYIRAYATSSVGTAYSTQLEFTTSTVAFACNNSFVDVRDNHIYTTRQIGEQCWMAENLNVGTKLIGSEEQTNNGTIEKYCYDNEEDNCNVYGGLYQWNEMMQYDTTSGRQGICPAGWFLPTDAEWITLTDYVSNVPDYRCDENSSYIAKALAAQTHWDPSTFICSIGNNLSENNATGFSGLPGGGFSGFFQSFSGSTLFTYWWSSTRMISSSYSLLRSLSHSNKKVFTNGFSKIEGLSVRCIKGKLPTINTADIDDITDNTASSGGNVGNEGSSPVTARGVCWSVSPNPTIYNNLTDDGEGSGDFTSNITGLSPLSTYYVRVYANNSMGTAYGEQMEFTTSTFACDNPMTDSRDGKEYAVVKIGEQCRMAENLNFGERIDGSEEQMNNDVIEKYCYNNIEDSCNTYGGLYQWNEMMQYTINESANGICPAGWHLPTDTEWNIFSDFIMDQSAFLCNANTSNIGKALAAQTNWNTDDTDTCNVGFSLNTNNATEFAGLPGGRRRYTGSFLDVKEHGMWWSSTQVDAENSKRRVLSYNDARFLPHQPLKSQGFSVRCLKGAYPTVSTSSTSNATPGSVITGGHISDGGGMEITARGVCWSTTEHPTLADSFTTDGAGTGIFSSSITGLNIGQSYFVRAYATNSLGTAYGEQQTILTASVMSPSGNALNFDGVNDYVVIPNENQFDFTDSLTVEAWIKVTAFNHPYQAIVTKGDNSWRIHRQGSTNHIAVDINGLNPYKLESNTDVSDGKWHHVAFVFDGTNTYLYIDGKEDDSNLNVDGSINLNNEPVQIAANSEMSGRNFNGMIDEVRIWNDARTVDEIHENMFRPLSDTEDNLVSYWSMDQSSGNILTDHTGRNHGILQNMNDDDWVSSGAFAGPRNGIKLDGVDDRITIDHNSIHPEGTIEFWLYPESFFNFNTIFDNGGVNEWKMLIYANTNLSFAIDGESVEYNLNNLQGDKNWYHVAVLWQQHDGSMVDYYLYIDGVLRDTQKDRNWHDQLRYFYIGGNGDENKGKFTMDEFRYWSDMRTEQEIRENMCRTLTGNENNLLIYYRFDQTDGDNKVYDATSGNKYDYMFFTDASCWVNSNAFNTWVGCTDNSWGTASNWSTQQVPNADTTNVGIPFIAGGNNPSINSSYSCNNLTIETGATLSTSTGLVLSTFGNPYCYGTISGNAKVKMTGPNPMHYPSGNFVNLVLDNPIGASLSGDMTITGTLELTDGNMDQGSYNIKLGEMGYLAESGENSLSGTTGTISTTRALHAGDLSEGKNIAGLGAEITMDGALDITTITRGYSPQGTGQSSIYRYYDIAPASNTGLDASLKFHYNGNELNENEPGALKLYSSSDDGDTWQPRGGEVNEVNESISLDNLYTFSRWTASDDTLGNTLNAAFEADTTIGSTSFDVQFTDLSSYDNVDSVSWSWDFGNGNTSVSRIPASQTYSLNGDDLTNYTVSLTITEADSSSKQVKEDYITVCPDNYWVGEVDTTWTADESPYYVGGEIIVPLGDTLTIEPGVSVLFRPNSIDWQEMPAQPTRENIDFGFMTVYGTLDVQGEENDSVVFTRMGNKGSWGLVHIVDTANPGGEQIRYLKMEHASYMYDEGKELAGLCLDNNDVTVRNSRFSNNYIGIKCNSSNAHIEHNSLSENHIGISLTSSAAYISDNDIMLNQTNGITCLNDTSSITGNRIRFNVKNGLYCEQSDTAKIIGNTIEGNKNGIHSINSIGMIISADTIKANSEYGIICENDSTFISANDISDNGINGVDFYKSFSMVSGNNILNNAHSGIHCDLSDPSIEGNNITGNINGILCKNASKPHIDGNAISYNWAGIGCYEGSVPQILHNIIASNSNTGIDVASGAKATLVSNTITDNNGYGVYCYDDASVIIDNSILWGNGASIVAPGSQATVTWSCVQGGYEGEENIIKDPMFIQKGNEKYHLKWSSFPFKDGVNISPCINTGNPDLNGNDTLWIDDPEDRDPDMSCADMGARYYHQLPLVTIMYDNDSTKNNYNFEEQLFIPDVSEPKMFQVKNDADRLNECRLFFTDPPGYDNQFHVDGRKPDTDTILILLPYALDSVNIVYEPTHVINNLQSHVIVGERETYADSITLSGISIGSGTVQGTITTLFNSNVKDVTVSVIPIPPNGKVYFDSTDVNGFYSVSNVGYGEFYVKPEYNENGLQHEFNPEASTVQLYTNVPSIRNFNDVSVFPVSGRIVFYGDNNNCPSENILMKIDGSPTTATDENGEFTFGGVSLGYHTFAPELTAHTFFPSDYTIYVDGPKGGIDFIDEFTNNLSGYIAGAGGDFDTIPISSDSIPITFHCTANCMPDVEIKTDLKGFYSVDLPPLEYEVTPQGILYNNYGYPGDLPKDTLIKFDPVNVDLTVGDTIQDFFFHSEPVIEIMGFDSVTNGYNMVVLEQFEQYWVDIKVYEPYRGVNDEGSDTLYKCMQDTGIIVIMNNLSDLPGEEIPYSDTLPLYSFYAGLPNISAGGVHPYQKSLDIRYLINDLQRTAHQEWVYIVGQRPRASAFATTSPEIPLLILRDPPGDQSYSELSESTEVSTSISISHKLDESIGLSRTVNLGATFESLSGFGFQINTKVEVTLETTSSLNINMSQNWVKENQLSFETSEIFTTSQSDFDVGQKGDLYVGAAMNLIYGITDVLTIDGSEVKVDQELIVVPDGFETTYIYTEGHLENVVIPTLYLIGDEKSAHRWEDYIALNQSLKDEAEFIENISFNGGPSYSYTETTVKSKTNTFEFDLNIAREIALTAGVEINDFGLNGTVSASFGYTYGNSEVNTEVNTNTVSYTLQDDDQYDNMTVDIMQDPVYGTPVFVTLSGQTMCPHEENTQPRQGCSLGQHEFNMFGAPPDEEVVFQGFRMINEGQSNEAMDYELLVQNASNPYGAIIKAAGTVISASNSLIYNIPANELIEINISVARPPGGIYDFEGLKLELRSTCESGPGFSDIATFNVHFTPPCSPVSLQAPQDNWHVNQSNLDTLAVIINGYDYTNPQLNKIGLEYSSVNGNDWFEIFSFTRQEIQNTITQEGIWVVGNFSGSYRLRAFTECNNGDRNYSMIAEGVIDDVPPQVIIRRPTDNILHSGDEISFTFNEKLDPSSVNLNNIQIVHPDSGTIIPSSIQYDQDLKKVFLTIDPGISYFIEDETLQAEVIGVKDLNGNLLNGKDSINFLVNQGPLGWNPNSHNASIFVDESICFTSTLQNSSSKNVPYSVLLPNWLSADQPLSGNLSGAGGSVVYEFSSDSLTGQFYWDTISVTMLGYPKETLPISVTVTGGGSLEVSPLTDSVPSSIPEGAEYGEVVFNVLSSVVAWSVSENEEWLSLGVPNMGAYNGPFTIRYDENTSYYERTGEIYVSAWGMPDFVVTITQAGAEAPLEIDPYIQEVTATAGITYFYVTTNYNFIDDEQWKVDSIADWLSVSPLTDTANYQLSVAYSKDTMVGGRIGSFSVLIDGVYEVVGKVQQAGADTILSVEADTLNNLSYEQDTAYIIVEANCSWKLNESLDWLGIYPNSGVGDTTLAVYYTENTIAGQRSGVITTSVVGIPNVLWLDTIMVTQNGPPATLAVDTTEMDVPATSGSISFDVTSNTQWTASTDDDWLNPLPEIGNGSGTLSVHYSKNPLAAPRNGTVTLSADSVESIEITINQDAADTALVVSPANRNVSASDGATSFEISSTTTWSVSESANWLSVNQGTGIGDSTLIVNYEVNNLISGRIGMITILADGVPNVMVSINQAGGTPVLEVGPPHRDVTGSSGSTTFNVSSNINWMVWNVEDWISVSPLIGMNTDTITVSYEGNPSTNPRTASILIWGSEVPSAVVTITQDAGNSILTVSPIARNVTSVQDTTTFTITSNTEWTVSVETGVDWFTVLPFEGIENEVLKLVYNENTTIDERQGSITVEVEGVLSEVVTIYQAGGDTTLSVNPSNLNVPAFDSVTIFNVMSNTFWNAASNVNWLSVVPENGADSSAITVEYAKNLTIYPRVGSVMVSSVGVPDAVVTINQAGGDTTLSVNPSNLNVPAFDSVTIFNVNSNTSWKALSNVNWLLVDSTIYNDSSALTVNYAENLTIVPREGRITVSADGVPDAVVTINQARGDTTLSVNPEFLNVPAIDSVTIFNVMSNTFWNVASDVDWLSIIQTNGADSSAITVEYAKNLTIDPRVGSVMVSSVGTPPAVVTINQAGGDTTLSVNPDSLYLAAFEGDTIFNVASNTSWKALSNVNWLLVDSTIYNDSSALTVNYAENLTIVPREGRITVSADGVPDAVVIINQARGDTTLSVNPSNLNVTAIDSVATFNVASNTSWNVASDVDWLSVVQANGSDSSAITVEYAENLTIDPRMGSITVTADGADPATITINQAHGDTTLSVNPEFLNVPAFDSVTIFNVASNTSWDIVSNVEWLTVDSTNGSDSSAIVVHYFENPTIIPRVGSIVVSANGVPPAVVTINQPRGDTTLSVIPDILNVAAIEGDTIFNVSSNTAWDIVSDVGWLTVDTANGSNSSEIIVHYYENPTIISRVGSITVSADGVPNSVVTIYQSRGAPSLSVNPDTLNVQAIAGDTIFNIASNTSWNIACNVDWLTIVPITGSGSNAIAVHYNENPIIDSREGSITISADRIPDVVVPISQAGVEAILSVSPDMLNVLAFAGSETLDVVSNLSWLVRVEGEWLRTSSDTGFGNDVLILEYEENLSLLERFGKVIICSPAGLDAIVKVFQAGANPYLSVNPANQMVSPIEGTLNFDVISNCSWIANETEDWLSIDSPDSTGNGTITVSYMENSSASSKLGEVNIETADGVLGAIFTITQDTWAIHNVSLPLGWSGLSSYVMPKDAGIENIYDSILERLVVAITEEEIYYPAYNINTIDTWKQHSAYKVKTNAGANLNILGLLEENKTLQLAEGWNLIPVVSACPADVASLFAGLEYDLVIVKQLAGYNVYWPAMGINSLGNVMPGKAYYALATNAFEITFEDCMKGAIDYPPNSNTLGEFAAISEISPWELTMPTASTHSFAIYPDAVKGFDQGCLIGVFDPSGKCFGLTPIGFGVNGLTVFGNEMYCAQKVGFDQGELIRFRLYNPDTYLEFEIFPIFDTSLPNADGTFVENGLSAITEFKSSETGITNNFGDEIGIYPNPTTGRFRIMGIDADAIIEIFDINGQAVQYEISNATSQYELSLMNQQSGIYMVRIFSQGKYHYKKLILDTE